MMTILAYIGATYSEEDPLDVQGMTNLVTALRTAWWMQPPDIQKKAIANALRAALLSPQQNLKWNSITYQDLMHFPPDYNNPEGFENHLRGRKESWDRMGQSSLDMLMGRNDIPDVETYAPHIIEKYRPGIWRNVGYAGGLGPYIDQLRQAALEDIADGGDGKLWRQRVLSMNIPGVGPKIAAFAWLLLNPEGSKLATIDIHMMRALQQDQDVPLDLEHYDDLEKQLDANRKNLGYGEIPLGVYQWAVWDRQRTPGYHQDHTPLRPLNPTPWHQVDWVPSALPSRKKPPEVAPDQAKLFAKWVEPVWKESIWR